MCMCNNSDNDGKYNDTAAEVEGLGGPSLLNCRTVHGNSIENHFSLAKLLLPTFSS